MSQEDDPADQPPPITFLNRPISPGARIALERARASLAMRLAMSPSLRAAAKAPSTFFNREDPPTAQDDDDVL